MATLSHLTRREFLKARVLSTEPRHISSAVVLARPEQADGVVARLGALEGVEVHARQGGKIVVVMEAHSAGALGTRLTEISLMDGVLSANMVFEHLQEYEEARHE